MQLEYLFVHRVKGIPQLSGMVLPQILLGKITCAVLPAFCAGIRGRPSAPDRFPSKFQMLAPLAPV